MMKSFCGHLKFSTARDSSVIKGHLQDKFVKRNYLIIHLMEILAAGAELQCVQFQGDHNILWHRRVKWRNPSATYIDDPHSKPI